jgi:hypothetical protein
MGGGEGRKWGSGEKPVPSLMREERERESGGSRELHLNLKEGDDSDSKLSDYIVFL